MVWLIGHRQPKGAATAMLRPTATAPPPYSTHIQSRRWLSLALALVDVKQDLGECDGDLPAQGRDRVSDVSLRTNWRPAWRDLRIRQAACGRRSFF